MSVENNEAVITIKVKLESDVTGDPTTGGGQASPDFFGQPQTGMADQHVKDFEDLKKDTEKFENKFGGKDSVNIDNITDLVSNLDKNGISELTQFASSPQGYLEHGFIRILQMGGPYGALIVAIVAAALTGPELFKAVAEQLGVKGGPLNQDFMYSMDEQLNQQFDRRIQFKRLTGDDPVVTVSTKGYVVGDPDFVGSSLVNADLARTARIGLRDSNLGLIDGI